MTVLKDSVYGFRGNSFILPLWQKLWPRLSFSPLHASHGTRINNISASSDTPFLQHIQLLVSAVGKLVGVLSELHSHLLHVEKPFLFLIELHSYLLHAVIRTKTQQFRSQYRRWYSRCLSRFSSIVFIINAQSHNLTRRNYVLYYVAGTAIYWQNVVLLLLIAEPPTGWRRVLP